MFTGEIIELFFFIAVDRSRNHLAKGFVGLEGRSRCYITLRYFWNIHDRWYSRRTVGMCENLSRITGIAPPLSDQIFADRRNVDGEFVARAIQLA